VIGDGPERRHLDGLDLEHRFFEIRRVGDLDPKSLQGFLAKKVDIVTAMGTSALEGAQMGLPTILLDFSYGPVPPGYRFRWLYDTKGFDLGHAIMSDDCDATRDVLPEMMEAVQTHYATLGGRCFDYCSKNHGLSHVADRFLELVQSSSLRFGDIPGDALKKSFPRRVYERLQYPARQ
jgi:hypothetical protein